MLSTPSLSLSQLTTVVYGLLPVYIKDYLQELAT
jgi:hypothetical protein